MKVIGVGNGIRTGHLPSNGKKRHNPIGHKFRGVKYEINLPKMIPSCNFANQLLYIFLFAYTGWSQWTHVKSTVSHIKHVSDLM